MDSNQGERRRLSTLKLYEILDTAAEKAFDDLTRLAAHVCDTPISLVSLVDGRRQWFKSRVGLDVSETPRNQAFCAHAILEEGVMIVEDAAADSRFADNPLVTESPKIRFYAGAPLKMANDTQIGTLCVIDTVPRRLSEGQVQALKILRDAVVTQLEYRRNVADLRAAESLLQMCAWCRKVRTDRGGAETWQCLRDYVETTEAVTHGICPQCRAEMDTG